MGIDMEQVHINSTNCGVRILTKKKDIMSLQYTLELPKRKRNMLSIRSVMVMAGLLSLIWFKTAAVIIVSISVVLMLYLELSQVCKETVTVIKDTCLTYSANTLLGRKKFQSVPINRILGVVLLESIGGTKVHTILNILIRTGPHKSIQIPLFSNLKPNLAAVTLMRKEILEYTQSDIDVNMANFGKPNIMVSDEQKQRSLEQNQKLRNNFQFMRSQSGVEKKKV